ncbi:MAG TPA: hypothetical protein VKA70_03870 [Blastocatellia bacterium]|nr:hypothetical protein [Blastocatellia bacterium]
MRVLEIVLLSLYLIVVTLIGVFSRHSKDDEDFVIGSRNIGRLGTTMTLFGTLVTESVIFFAVILTAVYGPIGAMAGVVGPSLALLTLSFVAARAHADGAKNRYICISEYCRQRWGPVSGRLARFTLLMLMAWVIVLQINLNGKLLVGITGWTPVESTLLTVGVVLFYLMVGGYKADVRTDVFRGIVVGAVLLLPLVISPRPDLGAVLDARFFSVDVFLIFITSFALTITRPEMWQRVYSAASGRKAAQSMLIVALLYFCFGCFVIYYAIAILQAVPELTPDQAFAVGYRRVLPPFFQSLFPVLLLAAMMSSLDSATFLLSADLASLGRRMKRRRVRWSRIFIVVILLGSGLVSLTIFDSLAFAYKLNGIVALFAVPLLMSFWVSIPGALLGASLGAGLATYLGLLWSGRLDRNPVEAIIAALVSGAILLIGYCVKRYLLPRRWFGPIFEDVTTGEKREL